MDTIPTATLLEQHATAIKALGKRLVGDVIEIGRRLNEAKRLCGHGNWLAWLDSNFGWTDRTARNFMQVYEGFGSKSETVSDLNLPMSCLYLLAKPSTPEEVRQQVIKRAGQGEPVRTSQVKRLINQERKPVEQKLPTEEEADESWQNDIYDQACLLLHRMTSATRVKFIARLRSMMEDDDDGDGDDTEEGRWQRSLANHAGDAIALQAFWDRKFGAPFWKTRHAPSDLRVLARQAADAWAEIAYAIDPYVNLLPTKKLEEARRVYLDCLPKLPDAAALDAEEAILRDAVQEIADRMLGLTPTRKRKKSKS